MTRKGLKDTRTRETRTVGESKSRLVTKPSKDKLPPIGIDARGVTKAH